MPDPLPPISHSHANFPEPISLDQARVAFGVDLTPERIAALADVYRELIADLHQIRAYPLPQTLEPHFPPKRGPDPHL